MVVELMGNKQPSCGYLYVQTRWCTLTALQSRVYHVHGLWMSNHSLHSFGAGAIDIDCERSCAAAEGSTACGQVSVGVGFHICSSE